MSGITRRGFLRLAAGALVLRGVLRVSAEEGPRGLFSIPHPQYARPLGGGAFLVTWITDGGMSRLSVVSPEGTRDWASTGSADGSLLHPQGVCRDEDGAVYVCDSRNGRVAVFDSEGKAQAPIGRMGFLPGQFHLPQGCDVRGTLLAVADTQNHRVQLIDTLTLDVQSVIGRLGDGDGEFRRPSDVAFVDDDTLWILDSGHGRALRYDLDGKPLSQLTVPVGAQGLMILPTPIPPQHGCQHIAGLEVHGDHMDCVVVTDTRGSRVLICAPDEFITYSVDGLSSPRGVCSDGEGGIVVCESGANRLAIYSTPW